jgi:cysteinyl-tRNA synthetase
MVEGKRNVTDFSLWKFSPTDEKRHMEWDFVLETILSAEDFDNLVNMTNKNPNIRILEVNDYDKMKKVRLSAKGFPGWHIECSAMAMKYLGETFDIHTGGVDHINIHHTNEIAQSESATGKKFVNYWLHCEFMLINGQKMAKSLGNLMTLDNLIANNYSATAVRYLLASAHYRTQLNFTFDSLAQANETVKSIEDFVLKCMFLKDRIVKEKKSKDMEKLIKEKKKEFEKAMDDDLNTPAALASVHELVSEANKVISRKAMDASAIKMIMNFVEEINTIFSIADYEKLKKHLEIKTEEKDLIEQREEFRSKKMFKEADSIRLILRERGIILEDTPYGAMWKNVGRKI